MMQGKSLAQNGNRRRQTGRKPSQRTRRMLPDENEQKREEEKKAKLEAKQAQKQAALEAKEAKKQAKLNAREANRQAAQEQRSAVPADPRPEASTPQSAGMQSGFNNEPAEGQDAEPRKPRVNAKAVVKYTFILLSVSAVLSVGLLFALDLTGWRSNVREKIVGYLISKERETLAAQMTAEYEARVDTLVEQQLAAEREVLVLDQETAAARETELATREQEINTKQQAIDDSQAQLDADRAAYEQEKADFEAKKLEFENSKIEITGLADLYAGMERENAANIISVMSDRNLIVQILSSMKKDEAAEILELMDAQKAADIISEMGD